MVARTGGRLLDPRAATTFAGTSIPAAVFPAARILVRNLIALSPGRPGLGRRRGLPVWLKGQLHDAQVVAERVAQSEVDPVRVLGRLLGDLDTAGLQGLVGLAAIVRGETEREPCGALGDELANLSSRLLVHPGRAGQLEKNVASGLPRNPDGQPAHGAQIHVTADFQAELADIEVDCLVLVENEDAGYVDRVVHRLSFVTDGGSTSPRLSAVGRLGFSETAR